MDVWSEVPASVTPRPVIVPLGNVTTGPAIVAIDDGIERSGPAPHSEKPTTTRRAGRRAKEDHDG